MASPKPRVRVFAGHGADPEAVANRVGEDADRWLQAEEERWRASASNGWITVESTAPAAAMAMDASGRAAYFFTLTVSYKTHYQ